MPASTKGGRASSAAAAPSLDSILSRHAGSLRPGQTITLTLVKGKTSSSADPLLVRTAAGRKKNPPPALQFPRVAKFVETVMRPDFGGKFRDGRMFEEDVPEVKDESEDEDEADPRKKKRRWRKNEPPKQHFVLMEKAEFIEKMKRRKKAEPTSPDGDGPKLSTRYEGTLEHNPSSYVAMTVGDPAALLSNPVLSAPPDPDDVRPPEHLTVIPCHGFHSFSQPDRLPTMTMHEAEAAIADQRGRTSRYMMHAKEGAGAAGGTASAPLPRGGIAKGRLLGKLVAKSRANDPEGDDDDIMKDLAFRERKRGSGSARMELLNSMGDTGVTVDGDGVLGGGNDAIFGGARRFGHFAAPTSKEVKKGEEEEAGVAKNNSKKGGGGGGGGGERTSAAAGNDGLAMEDGFYQRDVSAEYEELDYDANEQFDDDDVDVGETEEVDAGGFAADIEDDLDDDDDEYDEEGFLTKGLASLSGLKALMAKDRGELVTEKPVSKSGDQDAQGRKTTAYGREDDEKTEQHLSDMSDDERSGDERKSGVGALAADTSTGLELGKDGQRIISLKSVQKEIWLNHGAITMKRLMKIFTIKKKAGPERMNKFREVVRELCTMKQDNVEGNMLVLKPHYSKM